MPGMGPDETIHQVERQGCRSSQFQPEHHVLRPRRFEPHAARKRVPSTKCPAVAPRQHPRRVRRPVPGTWTLIPVEATSGL